MKNQLREGMLSVPEAKTPDFCHSLRLALWQKNILDGWISRLEKVISVTHESFEEYYESETAGHMDAVTLKRADELTHLNALFGKLTLLATEIYNECIDTWKSETEEIGLGLRPPLAGLTISDWEIPTPVRIAIRFSSEKSEETYPCFHLTACYEPGNKTNYTTRGNVQRVLEKVQGTSNKNCDPSFVCIQYHAQENTRMTLPLGKILKEKPHLLHNMAWRTERPDIVYSISEWALLLWNTPWFQQLCCYVLTIEVNPVPLGCATQILSVRPQEQCQCRGHTSKLKNLGLVLAQLVLGTSIRLAADDESAGYEHSSNGSWEPISLAVLNEKILLLTGSALVQQAIYFCLRSEPELPSGDFKMGYLYMCIDKIF
ncbi:hypothetical protein CC86DRAFT_423282, partial [Ophiobolus disseminans]